MKIGIIAAMSKEIELLQGLISETEKNSIGGSLFYHGRLSENELIIGQCGIGKVCAAVGALELIKNYHPDVLINTGAAGGIGQNLKVKDIVVADKIGYYDVYCGEEEGHLQGFPQYFETDFLWRKKAEQSGAVPVMIASGDRFITKADEVAHIKDIYPQAAAVDMESAAIAQVCLMYNVPFLSLRIISDTPGVKNHNIQYENFWAEAGQHSFEIVKKIIG